MTPGARNAKVLPDPVSAIPIRSCPLKMTGKTKLLGADYTLSLYGCRLRPRLTFDYPSNILSERCVFPGDERIK